MNIVKLRDRLNEIIAENDRQFSRESKRHAQYPPDATRQPVNRNEFPVYATIKRGRNDWELPIRYVSGAVLGFTDFSGEKIQCFNIVSYECDATKEGKRKKA